MRFHVGAADGWTESAGCTGHHWIHSLTRTVLGFHSLAAATYYAADAGTHDAGTHDAGTHDAALMMLHS